MKTSVILSFGAAASSYAAALESLHERQSNWTVGQTVITTSGPVNGHAAPNASDVSEYLGIPFAQPPVGDLRFAAPQAFNGTATINGTSFGFACPVPPSAPANASAVAASDVTSTGLEVLASLGQAGIPTSEDCLTLNVWTKPQTGDSSKAVLVWIYGGGFKSGTASKSASSGENIVEQEDVIVVSINYRVNIFGFPGNPTDANNLGLLDQRLALEWVRDNIAKFGGDTNRITIFGQSAGAASVDYYSYAWVSDPIVAGFIEESGTAFSFGLPNPANVSAAAWFNVSSTLGCGDATSDSATVFACVKTKSTTDILNAIPQGSGVQSVLGFFDPTVDNTIVFSDYTARSAAGNFSKKPLLIGNNNNEAGLFSTDFALAGTSYPAAIWDAFNLDYFTCPAGVRANISIANNVPTWRYRYFGDFPDLTLAPGSGAWHGAELPLLFNTTIATPPQTAAEVSIGNYMRGAWVAFAKDPVNGLNNYEGGWPQYVPGQETLIRLAFNNVTGTNLALPQVYDAGCPATNTSTGGNSTASVAPTTSTGGSSTATRAPTSSASVSATGTSSGAVATQTSKSGAGKVSLSILSLLGTFLGVFLV